MLRTFARPLLASVFAVDGVQMLRSTKDYTDSAKAITATLLRVLPKDAAGYVPTNPETNVRIAAGTKIIAAAMLGTGKFPRLAAATLAITHIPVILTRNEQRNLVTDLALLGGLAITSADTAGKPGLRWRIQKAMPGQSEQQEMLETAKQQASAAGHAVTDYVDDHSDDWKETFDNIRDQVSSVADQVTSYAGALGEEATKASQRARKKLK